MILLVDDEKEIREMVGEILAEKGYRFCGASTGAEALKAVQKGNVDCAIVDIDVAGTNGIDLAKTMWELQPELKIICVSGLAKVLGEDLEKAGVEHVLEKPFREEELIDIVEKALRGS